MVSFRKKSKIRIHKKVIFKRGINSSNTFLFSGNFGIFSMHNSLLSKSTVESARVTLKRQLHKKDYLLGRSKFIYPITGKSSGVRMGKGKGQIKEYMNRVKINDILFEFKCLNLLQALKILKKISHRFGFSVGLVDRKGNQFTIKK